MNKFDDDINNFDSDKKELKDIYNSFKEEEKNKEKTEFIEKNFNSMEIKSPKISFEMKLVNINSFFFFS